MILTYNLSILDIENPETLLDAINEDCNRLFHIGSTLTIEQLQEILNPMESGEVLNLDTKDLFHPKQ